MSISIPSYVAPAGLLCEPVQIIAIDYTPKMAQERDGSGAPSGQEKIKENRAFPGRRGYQATVEYIESEREKTLPTGEVVTATSVKTENVLLWLEESPREVEVDSYVKLENLLVGSTGNSFYFWATGVEVIV